MVVDIFAEFLAMLQDPPLDTVPPHLSAWVMQHVDNRCQKLREELRNSVHACHVHAC